MDEMEIMDEIRSFILKEFLADEPPSVLKDDTPLQSGGFLDSERTLVLVDFLLQRYGIHVDSQDAGEFETLKDLAALVKRKL